MERNLLPLADAGIEHVLFGLTFLALKFFTNYIRALTVRLVLKCRLQVLRYQLTVFKDGNVHLTSMLFQTGSIDVHSARDGSSFERLLSLGSERIHPIRA